MHDCVVPSCTPGVPGTTQFQWEPVCFQICSSKARQTASIISVSFCSWDCCSVYKTSYLCGFQPFGVALTILNLIPRGDNLFHGSRVLPVVWLAFSPLLRRHESYKTQYRAMFVMNCFVNKEEILKYRKKVKKRNKKRKHSEETTPAQSNQEEEEVYHPVLCTECSTEVAVMDKDEVFHFFNVLASHS